MKPVRPATSPADTAPFGAVKAGDTVIVRTTDGHTVRFVVQQIQDDAIFAPDGVRFTRAEVAEVKRRSFSAPKSAGLAAAVFGAVFILYAAAAASALGGVWGY